MKRKHGRNLLLIKAGMQNSIFAHRNDYIMSQNIILGFFL